jgi:hypothetical protein
VIGEEPSAAPIRRLLPRCHSGGLLDSRIARLLRVAEHGQVRAYPLRVAARRGAGRGSCGPRAPAPPLPHPRTPQQPAPAADHRQERRVSRYGRRACGHLARADDHHEQFVRADQCHRWPRSHCGADQAMPEAVGDVHRERGRVRSLSSHRASDGTSTPRRHESSMTIRLKLDKRCAHRADGALKSARSRFRTSRETWSR